MRVLKKMNEKHKEENGEEKSKKEEKLPKGEGEIVDWDKHYCKKCNRTFETRGGLYSHIIHSKYHRKDLIKKAKEEEEKRIKYRLITDFF